MFCLGQHKRREVESVARSVLQLMRVRDKRDPYLCSGGIFRSAAANASCAIVFTGRCLGCVAAGYLPRKFSPFQFCFGRIGRATNPPPQFGHTLCSRCSTQCLQNVHSKLHIIASVEFGGRGLLQCSQAGRSSSML